MYIALDTAVTAIKFPHTRTSKPATRKRPNEGLPSRGAGTRELMASTSWAPPLTVTAESVGDSTVLNARGVLDGSTYLALRDRVIDAALEEPDAVIVEVTELDVPAESAWLALTSARRHVDRWPEVPISLVCRHAAGRDAIVRCGVARFLPVHSTIQSAVAALSQTHRDRRRARADLPAAVGSLKRSRDLVAEWLTAWSRARVDPGDEHRRHHPGGKCPPAHGQPAPLAAGNRRCGRDRRGGRLQPRPGGPARSRHGHESTVGAADRCRPVPHVGKRADPNR